MEYRRKIKNKCNGRPKGVNIMIIEKNEFGEEIKMIDGEEMHITFNGSWIPAFNCL